MGLTEHGPVELTPGPWWTLETFMGKAARTAFVFRRPPGVHVKIRYGIGWFGYDSQRQLTDGVSDRRLTVSGWVIRARVQAGVKQTTTVEWVCESQRDLSHLGRLLVTPSPVSAGTPQVEAI